MSNAQLGAGLLAEIQESSLDKLLTIVRDSLDTELSVITGIPEIDHLLGAATKVNDTPSEPEVGQIHDDGNTYNHPRGGQPQQQPTTGTKRALKTPFIEITASEARHEATDINYLLTATSVLPIVFVGQECCTIWLDTESRFSITRLYQVITRQVATQDPTVKAVELEQIAQSALKHVHVLSAQSSKQLLSILRCLPTYLLSQNESMPEHHSTGRRLSLIVLDTATSFHWSDRFDAELASLESIGSDPSNNSGSTSFRMLHELRTLRDMFQCTVVYTTDGTDTSLQRRQSYQASSTNRTVKAESAASYTDSRLPLPPPPPPPDDPILPVLSPWTSAADLSLRVSYVPTPQFASHMSVDECLRDRERRVESVRNNRVKISINKVWLDRIVRDVHVKEGFKASSTNGFVVRCTGDGVLVER